MEDKEPEEVIEGELIREKLDFKYILNKHLDRIGRASVNENPTGYMSAIMTLKAFIMHRLKKEPNQVILNKINDLARDVDERVRIKIEQWKSQNRDNRFQPEEIRDRRIREMYGEVRAQETYNAGIRILELLMEFMDNQGLLLEVSSEEEVNVIHN
jgi:hypothetical protein